MTLFCDFVYNLKQFRNQDHHDSASSPRFDVGSGYICRQQRHYHICLVVYSVQLFTGEYTLPNHIYMHGRYLGASDNYSNYDELGCEKKWSILLCQAIALYCNI